MVKEVNNNGPAAGNEAQRESRARQASSDAERRAQSLRNQLLRQRQRDMALSEAAAEPVIGAELAAMSLVAAMPANEVVSIADVQEAGDLPSDQHTALAHLSCVLGVFGELLVGAQGEDSENGGDDTIIGSGDRAFDRALKTAFVPLLPRPFSLQRPAASLPPLRPTSRLACQRRCGKSGFCDPASALGCGGQYCPVQPDLLSTDALTAPYDGGEPGHAHDDDDATAMHDID